MSALEATATVGHSQSHDALPWLSVLIPVHNAELYLEECIHSVCAQAHSGVEIIAFDDASTDGSRDVLGRMQARYPEVLHLLHSRFNQGVSDARNALLTSARGEYIWFLDADDVMQPAAISRLRRVIEDASPDLVLCDHRVLQERYPLQHRLRSNRYRRTFDGLPHCRSDSRPALIEGLLRRGQLHVWTKIAHRRIWPRQPFPPGRYYEDISATAALLGRAQSWYYAADAWIGYRRHGTSLTAAVPIERAPDLVAALADLRSQVETLIEAAPAACFALDYFQLRSFTAIARQVRRSAGPDVACVANQCRSAFQECFPSGISATIEACRAQGWWLRAWRMRRALSAVGWC